MNKKAFPIGEAFLFRGSFSENRLKTAVRFFWLSTGASLQTRADEWWESPDSRFSAHVSRRVWRLAAQYVTSCKLAPVFAFVFARFSEKEPLNGKH
ncbi:hypothetical protein EFA69_07835 [Rufibacter immobilis]|uniref:Uncharacterized protein n=1 Tax=Rufibacter immobilis TaxID=1348778 RepID=A0A3M9MVH0_9BACT|nr:hypothetical protein [Rufibacter immobilis]RNI29460.1 hypothetical protein EFA69_07835 [Rufibacter immobilis]